MSEEHLDIASKKDRRILKCIKNGVGDPKIIARKIGYSGDSLTAGIERVKEGMERLRKLGHIQ